MRLIIAGALMTLLAVPAARAADARAALLDRGRHGRAAATPQVLGGDDAGRRATLIASQLIGMATARYVIALEPLAGASIDDVVGLYAPAMQKLIT